MERIASALLAGAGPFEKQVVPLFVLSFLPLLASGRSPAEVRAPLTVA